MTLFSRRHALHAAGWTTLALSLSGCVPSWSDPRIRHDAPAGGQTLAEATAAVSAVQGLLVTELSSAAPNAKGNTGYSVGIEVQPGFEVVNGAALVDYLVRTVWSIREGYQPNTTIAFSVTDTGATPWNVYEGAASGEWLARASQTDRGVAANGVSFAAVWLDPDTPDRTGANLERLGAWPGPVPPAPLDAVRRVG